MNKKKQASPEMTPFEMQQAAEEIMRELGVNINAALREYFPRSCFALVVFKLDEPKIGNYISSAERDSMIEALEETIIKLKMNKDMPAGSGTVH